ncbi:hypothetical protein LCGC14_1181370 [marine sediment metagenome]|uniref:Uncharacterized protein n=1 Tax=marine sediment metagenome TaxID=412755 RepID=A0A0F9PSH9_9ZZZZ
MANEYVELLASLARTANVNTPDQTNFGHKGLHLIIDVTAINLTPSVVPTIQGKDPLSGKYYDLLVGVAIIATGTTILKIYPGIVAAANVAASDILPLIWRLQLVHADADSITYSVAAALVT